jgi:hypothetical protein
VVRSDSFATTSRDSSRAAEPNQNSEIKKKARLAGRASSIQSLARADVNHHNGRPSLRFVGARQGQRELQLEWAIDDEVQRLVTVRVRAYGSRRSIEFPHLHDEGGQTLGCEEVDLFVRRRSEQLVALLDAAEVWRTFTSRERESR